MTTRNTWAINRRLRFIERRLKTKGRVNRADLMKMFSISERQASYDLGHYIHKAPDNMRHDPLEKAYVRSELFAPVLTS